MVWGAWSESDIIVELMIKNEMSIYGYVDRDKAGTTYNSINVFSKEIIKSNKNEYYIFMGIIYHKEVVNYLNECGYKEIEDFYWPFNDIAVCNCTNYRDLYMNEIIGKVDNFIVKLKMGTKLIIG